MPQILRLKINKGLNQIGQIKICHCEKYFYDKK